MNWPRIILDGLAMALFFNAVVGIGFLLFPQEYTPMFPKEIKEAAAAYVNKKNVRKVKLIIYPLYPFMFIFWAFSAHFAGISGFKELFWTGYVEMTMVSLADFLILDCWLPPMARPFIKGAENCKAWGRKEWLLKLGVPEHGLGWPLLCCPIAGLAVAGLNVILP